jgi:hypothetical protein
MIQRLVRFKVEEKYPSLNQWYSGRHWGSRSSMKKRWLNLFKGMIAVADIDEIASFEIVLQFNTGYDVDNNIPIVKVFSDALVESGVVANDNRKFWKDLSIHYDDTLPKNTAIINLYYKPIITDL